MVYGDLSVWHSYILETTLCFLENPIVQSKVHLVYLNIWEKNYKYDAVWKLQKTHSCLRSAIKNPMIFNYVSDNNRVFSKSQLRSQTENLGLYLHILNKAEQLHSWKTTKNQEINILTSTKGHLSRQKGHLI